jgi:hypothetical protein
LQQNAFSLGVGWRRTAREDTMGNPFKALLRLLRDASVSKIEVSAGPPFAKLTFDKAELSALLQGQSQISDVVARCFVRRRVFWEDIRKENREAVVASLAEVESQLDEWSARLSSAPDASAVALSKFVRAWATASSLVRKQLVDRLRDIDEEKSSTPGYDWANEDRDEAVHDTLLALRQRVYPIVTMLIGFLEDDDPTKAQAQGELDRGLNLVPDATIQRGCMPDVDVPDA